MKYIMICMGLALSGGIHAQSKKELQSQVESLKLEINQLKAENEDLKKPRVIVLENEVSKASYGLGSLMAQNIKNQGVDSLDIEAIQEGFEDAFFDRTLDIDQQQTMPLVQTMMETAYQRKIEKMRGGNNAFFAENRVKPGIKETASGLQYEVIKQGTGKTAGPNDRVTVHYTGKLLDGTIFDSSIERGQPATFGVTQVIPGWTEALQLMREGDKWTLYIPDQLGYGERGAGGQIPPYAALVFEVELIKVN